MTEEEKQFIIETIEELIGWTEYTPDYFAEKHNLKSDIVDAKKSIELLKDK